MNAAVHQDYYAAEYFMIGKSVRILKQEFFIYDMDEFTNCNCHWQMQQSLAIFLLMSRQVLCMSRQAGPRSILSSLYSLQKNITNTL